MKWLFSAFLLGVTGRQCGGLIKTFTDGKIEVSDHYVHCWKEDIFYAIQNPFNLTRFGWKTFPSKQI